MSKYGTTVNKAANNAYGTQSAQANAGAEKDLGQYRQNEADLKAGKNVGANPYMNPEYLSAVGRLRSGALDQQNNAADSQIRALNARTGGMNGTAANGAITKIAGDKMRLGNQEGAERTASDWQKNIGYQQQLAGMPLGSAGVESNLYGTATGGQGGALKNLTELQQSQNDMYMKMAQMAMQSGAAGISAAMPPKAQ